MRSKYKYKIKVNFKGNRPECKYKTIYSQYMGSKGNTDKFQFTQKGFTIFAERSKKYKDGSILNSSNNSLNSQLLKGLLFFYGISKDFPLISKILIILYKNGKSLHSYSESANFEQPLISKLPKTFSFSPGELEIIFEPTIKASSIRIALSYWLKGAASISSYQKFDYLWRAFNRLYLFNVGSKSDNDGQREIRTLIISNSVRFGNSATLAKRLSLQDLELFRWRKLIIHEYDTNNKMLALHDFIKRYSDCRIMQALNAVISVRKQYLMDYAKNGISRDLWSQPNGIEGWLLNHLHTINDIEITCILCIKYAYFLRNQYFHGEIIENTFKVKNTIEDSERNNINQLLECLIFELILNNDLLRNA